MPKALTNPRGPLPTSEKRDQDEKRDQNEELLKFLNELRVMMPGVQVLFAFLLTVPFMERFARATEVQRGVYVVALLCAAAATVFIVAPTINHRLRWHEGAAERIMATGNRLVITGTVFLALAMGASVFLVMDVIFGGLLAELIGAAILATATWLWWVMALVHRARHLNGDR